MFWFPEQDDLVEENPPCFAFVRPVSGKEYTVVVEDERGNNVYTASTTKNYAVPDFLLSAGRYRWRVFSDGWTGEWRNFYLSAEAVEFLRPSAQMVWDSIPDCHPRHLFYEKDIPEILRTKGRSSKPFGATSRWLWSGRCRRRPPITGIREPCPIGSTSAFSVPTATGIWWPVRWDMHF